MVQCLLTGEPTMKTNQPTAMDPVGQDVEVGDPHL